VLSIVTELPLKVIDFNSIMRITQKYFFCVLASMPERKRSGTIAAKDRSTALSSRTKKQIDSLPEHAQEIYKKAHANALKQYHKPEKRRGGKRQSVEQVAHKVAWAAVKRVYEKEGDRWIEKAAKVHS
jgi:cation transport regulator